MLPRDPTCPLRAVETAVTLYVIAEWQLTKQLKTVVHKIFQGLSEIPEADGKWSIYNRHAMHGCSV